LAMAFCESETLELKRSTSELKEAVISMAAMLNKHGQGVVIFGIDDNGKAVGQDIGKTTIPDISRSISDHIEPKIFPAIREEAIDGKPCIRVVFSGNQQPYFAHGRAHIRVGDKNPALSARELEELIVKKNRELLRWDRQACPDASLDDLDGQTIKRFLDSAKSSKRLDIGSEEKKLLLSKLGLFREGKLTNAAIVLFGKEPQRFFPNTTIRCGRFRDMVKEEFDDLKDLDGNLFEVLDKAMVFLKEHLRLSARIEGLQRKERWEIPVDALREAIINALIHRDYSSPSFVYIKIYDEKIVIANPGSLPDGMKIEDLYHEHESRPGNPTIARVFYYAGYIEEWGRGILNIIQWLEEEKLAKPVFEQSGGSFRMVFGRMKAPVKSGGKKQGTILKLYSNYPVTILKILGAIGKNPHIRIKQIAKEAGLSEIGAKYNIRKLKKDGILRRVGSDKNGYWEVIKATRPKE